MVVLDFNFVSELSLFFCVGDMTSVLVFERIFYYFGMISLSFTIVLKTLLLVFAPTFESFVTSRVLNDRKN